MSLVLANFAERQIGITNGVYTLTEGEQLLQDSLMSQDNVKHKQRLLD
jgi:hypothetical protein